MKSVEIRGLSKNEILEKIGTERETLRKIEFAHQISSIENPMKIRETRKLIARLKTELAVKESQK
jgi:large subunit ribosomal protein L29